MCFQEDGNRLLITTQYECYECNLGSGKLATVTKAGPNERLAAGNYRGEEVEVAVVEHSGQEQPSVKPHCTYYRRGADGAYLRSWYYLMPELDEKLFRYFLYATGDLGFGGSNDEKASSSTGSPRASSWNGSWSWSGSSSPSAIPGTGTGD